MAHTGLMLPADAALRIQRETVLASPPLCPELTLHLITPACRLWTATEVVLEALGWPEPYWAFAWAGGQALARYILDHPEKLAGRNVLDLGAGSAVEGIAAACAQAARVRAVDIDPWAEEAARLNARHNGVVLEVETEDRIGQPLEGFDLILAGDMTYGEGLTHRVTDWFRALRRQGIEIWIADPGRGFLKTEGLVTLAEYDAPADVDPSGRSTVPTPVYRMA